MNQQLVWCRRARWGGMARLTSRERRLADTSTHHSMQCRSTALLPRTSANPLKHSDIRTNENPLIYYLTSILFHHTAARRVSDAVGMAGTSPRGKRLPAPAQSRSVIQGAGAPGVITAVLHRPPHNVRGLCWAGAVSVDAAAAQLTRSRHVTATAKCKTSKSA